MPPFDEDSRSGRPLSVDLNLTAQEFQALSSSAQAAGRRFRDAMLAFAENARRREEEGERLPSYLTPRDESRNYYIANH